ncbi:MAG TPA: hypothetical protein VHS13_03575 [Edaphobacter sp.]|nr:hypothetical protein [Edaphobacter sp.]
MAIVMLLHFKKPVSVHFCDYVIRLRGWPANDTLLAFPSKNLQLSVSEGCRLLLDSYPSFPSGTVSGVLDQNFQLIEHCASEVAFAARDQYWANILDGGCDTLPCLLYPLLMPQVEDEESDHNSDGKCNVANDCPKNLPIATRARTDGD